MKSDQGEIISRFSKLHPKESRTGECPVQMTNYAPEISLYGIENLICFGSVRACPRIPKRSRLLRWPNTVSARVLANVIQCAHKDHKNKPAVDTVIILFAQYPLYLCFLFFVFEHSVLMVLILLQRYVRKGNNAKNPAILGFSLFKK